MGRAKYRILTRGLITLSSNKRSGMRQHSGAWYLQSFNKIVQALGEDGVTGIVKVQTVLGVGFIVLGVTGINAQGSL